MGNPINAEPAFSIGAFVSGVLAAVWAILMAAGVEITEDLRAGVEALVWLLILTPAVTGFLTRFAVTPTPKAEAAIEEAFVATPGQDPKPTL